MNQDKKTLEGEISKLEKAFNKAKTDVDLFIAWKKFKKNLQADRAKMEAEMLIAEQMLDERAGIIVVQKSRIDELEKDTLICGAKVGHCETCKINDMCLSLKYGDARRSMAQARADEINKAKHKIKALETELGKVLKDMAKSEAKNINDSIEIGQLKLKIKNIKKALAGSLTTENVEKWLLNYHNGEGFLIIARCDLRNELRKLNSKKPEPIEKA
jgi:hypothetical protein